MRVFIYVQESVYEGRECVYNTTVEEVSNLEEADKIGKDMCLELVEAFHLEPLYESLGRTVNNSLEWMVFEIRDDVDMSTEALSILAFDMDFELFVEEYCKDE